MSPEVPPPAPPPPPPPATPSPLARFLVWLKARNDATQARWDDILAVPRVARTRLLAKVVAVHVRYVCGYMMTGFLVSAPISLGMRHEAPDVIVASILLGGLFALPFVALIPFTKIDWAKMRLPEFKNLELSLIKWSTIASLAFLLTTHVVRLAVRSPNTTPLEWLFDPHIAWVNLVLMGFAWLRFWFEHWMFRDFYTLHPEDDTLVLFRLPPEARGDARAPSSPPPPTAEPGRAPPGPGTDVP
jgi:hypothetical protein